MKKKLLAFLLILVMVVSVVPAVSAEGSYIDIQITPSKTDVAVGDTVEYTVTATGKNIVCMEFTLQLPEGLTFVAGSGSIPSGLKDTVKWAGIDWTESSMKWTGYNDVGTDFPTDTVIMTFSCKVEAAGTYQPELFELLPFDGDWADVVPNLTVGKVTAAEAGGDEPVIPEGAFVIDVAADKTEIEAGETVNYTITATGKNIVCMEFTLKLPEGLKFNAGSGSIPSGLKDTVKWAGIDWTESSMKWTGYNDVGTDFPANTVIMTFSCTGETAGTYEVELFELLPFDGNWADVIPTVSIDTVTVTGGPCEHTFSNYVSNGDATCTADGTKTASCDKGCGATDTQADVGSALGHDFAEYLSDGNATCTEDGTKTAICSRCDATDTQTDAGTALGHTWTDATCTAAKTCSVCGATEGEALGHNYGAVVTAPTCTEAGYTTYTCSVCGDTYVADEVAALGHTFGEYVSNGDATCTADGTKTATCSVCGTKDVVADAGSALGHAYGEYVANNDATCTADGTKTATCSVCGATDTVADEGTALGHTWIDATCTTAKTCSVCGATEGDALGHSVEEYTSNNDATCTEDGTKSGVCSVCGETVTVTDEGTALGHDLVAVEATVTCTEAGHVGYYACSHCDAWFEDATASVEITDKDSVNVEALGHIDEDADYICDRCGAELPKEEEPTEPSETPSEPSETPSEPSEEPTEKPDDKPATPDKPADKPVEENPKTGNDGMALYVAMMIVAMFGIFATVILGKKKFTV